MIEFLAKLPSTNFRIVVTMTIVQATAARYLLSGVWGLGDWTPSWEWLSFLALMAGIDAAQFWAKRETYTPAPPAAPDVEDNPEGKD